MRKRIASILLACCLLVSLVPTALAAPGEKLPAPKKVEILAADKIVNIGGEDWYFEKGEVFVEGIPDCLPDIHYIVTHQETGEVVEDMRHDISNIRVGTRCISMEFGFNREDPLPTGHYIVKACFAGDEEKYADSDWVTSEPYDFKDPGYRYEPPANLRWEGLTPRFDLRPAAPAESGAPKSHRIVVDFMRDEDQEIKGTMETWIGFEAGELESCQKELKRYLLEVISWGGEGNYRFRVRTNTEDRTLCQASPWSEWSEPTPVSANPDPVGSELDRIQEEIFSGGMEKQDALDAVKQMDQDALKGAIAADREGVDVTSQIDELEHSMGLSATVTKDENSTVDVDPREVSIVGAGLNTADVNTPPSMTIADPPADLVIPDAYQSMLQVDLSLTGAVTQEDGTLHIPVRITLPVPTGMTPEKLRILHFRQGSSHPEIITPFCYVDQHSGDMMATFIVDHLSPFVMAAAGDVEVLRQNGRAVLMNHGAAELPAQLLAAGYDQDGRFLGVAANNGTLKSGESLSVDLAKLQNAESLRAFVLDNNSAPRMDAWELN